MNLQAIGSMISSDGVLLAIGIFLTMIVVGAWYMSNRAEVTPTPAEVADLRHFVTGHFARYVARGLAAEPTSDVRVPVSEDRAWRNVFLQQLRLHNELYQFAKPTYTTSQNCWTFGLAALLGAVIVGPILVLVIRHSQYPYAALRIFKEDIDAAVTQELAALRNARVSGQATVATA